MGGKKSQSKPRKGNRGWRGGGGTEGIKRKRGGRYGVN